MPSRKSASEHDQCIDALRLTAREQSQLLARLDAQSAHFRGDNRRDGSRFSYQIPQGIIVEITHPGGTLSSYLVRPRDLSSRGMSFLHGAFVYPNSPCRIMLRTAQQETVSIAGHVMRCQHVSGRAHDIGVQFNKTLQLQDYLESESAPGDGPALPAIELRGKALYIENSIVDRELIRFHLRNHAVQLSMTGNVAEALPMFKDHKFDVVLLDIDQSQTPAAQSIDALRQAGHTAAIIIVTADENSPHLVTLQNKIGVTSLIKPYPVDTLLTRLSDAMSVRSQTEMLSHFWNQEEMRPLITTFVHDMGQKLTTLAQHITASEWSGVERMSLELKGAAGGYGYQSIQNAAQELHQLSKTHDDLSAVQAKLRELIQLADTARVSIERQ